MSENRQYIDLSGEWRFALDPDGIGVLPYVAGWYEEIFPDTLQLPGSLWQNKKGVKNTVFTKHFITPTYSYRGIAWYQRDIEIPEEWRGKHIELYLERAQVTTVWVDDNLVGGCGNQDIEQIFDITDIASPGKHTITIRNDNLPQRPKHSNRKPPFGNGIFGKIQLRCSDKVFFKDVYIKPHVDEKIATIHMWIANQTGINAWGELMIDIATLDGSHVVSTKRQRFLVECSRESKLIEHEVFMGEDVKLWDEFNPNVYEAKLSMRVIAGDQVLYDSIAVRFGMRKFSHNGKQFTINGKTIFLRGDALLHEYFMERSGLNSFNAEDWKTVLRKYKEYGINHLRFHTHCPPKALFEAADEVGIYVQTELTMGGMNGMTVPGPDKEDYDPMLEPTMQRRGKEKLLWLYNHPSFVMFTLGNEINGDMSILKRLVDYMRSVDNTRLYAQGTNNNLRNATLAEGDDFWVTEKVSERENVRGSVSHIYPPLGPVQDELPRNSLRDYSEAIKNIPIPVVAHEMGQYETTFNYDEMDRLDPELEVPGNMLYGKKVMEEKGLVHKQKDFYRDSGKLSVLSYREDIETLMRTPHMGGFQIMTLSDIQMAGTALTGILNMFFESKNMLEPREWRCFCNDRVVLLRIGSFTFRSGERAKAKIQLANYGPSSMTASTPYWKLYDGGKIVSEGILPACDIPQGCLYDLGEIEILMESDKPCKRVLEIGIEGEDLYNRYNLWVYPEVPTVKHPDVICTKNTDEAAEVLQKGGKVLFVNKMMSQDKTIVGYFAANFWSLTMFSGEGLNQFQTWPNEPPRGCMTPPGSMGLSHDPRHPALKYFPSDGYSDYQWFPIVMASNPVILDDFPERIEPIIWTIDSPQRGHRVGTLFEVNVGNGKLMVCTADLDSIEDIQAAWLKKGILEYMSSPDFKPVSTIPLEFFKKFFAD